MKKWKKLFHPARVFFLCWLISVTGCPGMGNDEDDEGQDDQDTVSAIDSEYDALMAFKNIRTVCQEIEKALSEDEELAVNVNGDTGTAGVSGSKQLLQSSLPGYSDTTTETADIVIVFSQYGDSGTGIILSGSIAFYYYCKTTTEYLTGGISVSETLRKGSLAGNGVDITSIDPSYTDTVSLDVEDSDNDEGEDDWEGTVTNSSGYEYDVNTYY